MKIKLKNIPRGQARTQEIIDSAEYFLKELLGNKVARLGNITISFKKLPRGVDGRARSKLRDNKNYWIDIDKYASITNIFKVLAHECTHVKQYFLKELYTQVETVWQHNRLVRRRVRIWKGKKIRRSKYYSRAWEVEARKFESLADKFRTRKPVAVIEKPVIKQAINEGVGVKIVGLLSVRDYLNDDLVGKLLSEIKDAQARIQALKEIYRLKENKIIEQYYKNSVTWIRLI